MTIKFNERKYGVQEFGRSMIEMLGVLAIIGILSAGGISAYRKAMTKYEANKWTEDMQLVVENFTFYAEEWKRIAKKQYTGRIVGVTEYVYDAGLVPQYMKQSVSNFGAYPDKIAFRVYIKTNDLAFSEKCRNLFNLVIIPHNETISFVHRYGYNGSDNSSHQIYYKGWDSCKTNDKCLLTFTFNDVLEACRYYEKEIGVSFVLYFK